MQTEKLDPEAFNAVVVSRMHEDTDPAGEGRCAGAFKGA